MVDDGRVNQPRDEQPVFEGGHGIKTRIEMLIWVDRTETGDLADGCNEAIEMNGKRGDSRCMYVQLSFDVPAKYRAEEAGIAPGPMLTKKGRQIDRGTIELAVPGAKGVGIAEFYPGGEPGSTLRWDVGSNELGYKTLKYKIPKKSEFLPLNFS